MVLDPRAIDELLAGWRDVRAHRRAGREATKSGFSPSAGRSRRRLRRLRSTITESTLHRCSASPSGWAKRPKKRARKSFRRFPGQELLWDGDRVVGVRTGDKGVDHDGKPKANYEPGADLIAKVVVLGEGPRGTLAKQAIAKPRSRQGQRTASLRCRRQRTVAVSAGNVTAGSVIHTLGYPLPPETFGGGFIYAMAGDVLDVGQVTGLDYKNPTTDPHNELQRLKQHPAIRRMLDGAKLIRYGAKAIPEGGLFAMPRLYAGGLLLIGDSAVFSTACGSRACTSR